MEPTKTTPREEEKEIKQEKEVVAPNIQHVKLQWGGSVYLEVKEEIVVFAMNRKKT